MIYVYLEGRLGNLLYYIATAASLAKYFSEDYCAVVNKNYYCTPPDDCFLQEYIAPLRNTIFRNVSFADAVPDTCPWWIYGKHGEVPPIKKGEDICLYGMSFTLSHFSDELISSLFAPSAEMIANLKQRYPMLNARYTCSIAVRRGDFLNLPMQSPVEDYAFYRKCMNKLQKKWQTTDIHYFITSDDPAWCKANFVGAQYTIVEDSYVTQLYIASLCLCNILSNSTFAQWGGVMNVNTEKIVYYPDPLGGIGARHSSLYRLKPRTDWIPVKHYSAEYRKGIVLWLIHGFKKYVRKIIKL